MKLSSKGIIFTGLFLFMSVSLLLVFLFSDPEGPSQTNDYKINEYNVTATVYGGGQVDVREAFTVTYMTSGLHGVQRHIPLKQDVYFKKGGKTVKKAYKVDLKNAYSNDSSFNGVDGDYYYFRLGSEFKTLKRGDVVAYELSYTLKLPDDRMENMDVFYFNILPADWDCRIDYASFQINYAFGNFTAQELQEKSAVYVGEIGSTRQLRDVVFNENSISGVVKNLSAFNGVTVYSEFENGAYLQKNQIYIIISAVGLALIVILAVVCFILFKRTHKPKQVVPVVEFSAPDGLTPAECGYIIDGIVDNNDLVSMIIYWAEKGFLQIDERDKSIRLIKLGELNEDSKPFEKQLFKAIFANKNSVNIREISNLGENIRLAKARIKNDVKHSIFERKSMTMRHLFTIFAVLLPCVCASVICKITTENYLYILLLLAGVGILTLSATGLYNFACDRKHYNTKTKTNIYKVLAYLLVIASLSVSMLIYEFYVDKLMILPLSHIFSMFLVYLGGNVVIRTEKSVEMLGKIIGLKNFILYAEKDRIEMLGNENPQMFFKILPYAFVLNVTDFYCEKFKNVPLNLPDWYVSDTLTSAEDFSTSYFAIKIGNTMRNATSIVGKINTRFAIGKAINSNGGSKGSGRSSGGGRSGGGFSGGGFGGGGGRGW